MIAEFVDSCSTGDLVVLGICAFVVAGGVVPIVIGFLSYIAGMGTGE